jgi:hypothetical protein
MLLKLRYELNSNPSLYYIRFESVAMKATSLFNLESGHLWPVCHGVLLVMLFSSSLWFLRWPQRNESRRYSSAAATDCRSSYGIGLELPAILAVSLRPTKVLCCAEIMANFLEHIFLQRPSLPVASHEAWMRYVQDHYSASRVVREFITDQQVVLSESSLPNIVTGMRTPS